MRPSRVPTLWRRTFSNLPSPKTPQTPAPIAVSIESAAPVTPVSIDPVTLSPAPSDTPNDSHQTIPPPKKLSFWDHVRLPVTFFSVVYGVYFGWQIYRSEFDVHKAMLRSKYQHKKLWHWMRFGTDSVKEAKKNSKFSSGLSPELTNQIAFYFLQLDNDKANGVRRSDVIAVIQDCGVENVLELPAVKQFVEAGRGRTNEGKRRAGCQLQEVLELFEDLLLGKEGDMKNEAGVPLSERVLDNLKKQTKSIVSTTLAQNLVFPSHTEQPEENDVSDVELLKADLERLKRLRGNFLQQQSRSGLSPAQAERLLDVEEQIASNEHLIDKHSSASSLAAWFRRNKD